MEISRFTTVAENPTGVQIWNISSQPEDSKIIGQGKPYLKWWILRTGEEWKLMTVYD